VSPLDKEYLIEEASGLIKIPGLEHKNSPLKREVPAVATVLKVKTEYR